MRRRLPCCLLLAFCLSACDTSTTIESTSTSCFALCLEADADVDVRAELAAVTDVKVALESVRATFAAALSGNAGLSGVAGAVVHSRLRKPSGYTYKGNGVYSVDTGKGAVARVTYLQGRNTSYGSVGDPITFDLFDSANYFSGLKLSTGVSLSLSGVDTNVELGFSSSGPGAELLGLGAKPSAPITVNESKMTSALTETRVLVEVDYTATGDNVVRQLALSAPPLVASDATKQAAALTVEAFSATEPQLKQTLSADIEAQPSLSLKDGGAVYDGSFRLRSKSLKFAFDAELRFSGSADADIAFGCPGSALSFSSSQP